MSIRKARLTDAEAIRDIILCAGEIGRSVDFNDQSWNRFLSLMDLELIRERLQRSELMTLCHTDGDHIDGVITIKNNDTINQLFVLPDHHRQGIARKLWQSASAICIAHGNEGRFFVRSSALAVPVYESFGFVQSGGRSVHEGVWFTPMTLTP